jgi:SAM-dependent methyltransferase
MKIPQTVVVSEHYANQYGKAVSPDRSRAILDLLTRYLRTQSPKGVRILDIGCGNGEALAHLLQALQSSIEFSTSSLDVIAWELSPIGAAEARARGIECKVKDVCVPIDPDDIGRYEVILFTEVLEHILDTGTAVENIRRLLRPGGALVLTTPNLASWYNRLMLLMGFQPHMTEVSFDPYRYGCRFVERLFRESPGTAKAVGHIRLFTYRALIEFLVQHQYRIVATRGVATHGDALSRIICKFWTGGAGDVALLAVPED